MARMYPEFLGDEYTSTNPEAIVFESLKQLPDHYAVIHSKKIKGGSKHREEVELDFIIFDGKKNLICLEVKGGEISFDGQTNRWFQNGKEMHKKPDWQASRACHAVIEFLGRDAANVNINWALCFPHSSRADDRTRVAEVPQALLLDESNLDDFTTAIAAIEKYNETKINKPGLNNRFEGDRILSALLQSIGFIKMLGVRTVREQNQLIKMTESQMEAMEDFEVNPRMAVMGFAGTGKTVLATEYATRLATREQSVLFLFYNRLIANTVRRGIERELPINITTFHSFAKRLIDDQDPSWWDENKKNDDFWQEDIPLKLLDLDPHQLPKFDTIIVDEAQDFKPDWFEIIELMLSNNDSRYLIFYDENQDIFGRWNKLPAWADGFTKKVLRRNCRNTINITKYLQELIPSNMVPFEQSPVGEEVKVVTSHSQAEETEAVKTDIEKLLSRGVNPADILVLTNKPMPESSIKPIEKVGGVKFEWCGRKPNHRSKCIQTSNINNYKGLESPVVLIVDFAKEDVKAKPEYLYTQASRAKNILIVYLR